MEKVRVEDAVGKVLCHDLTRIVVGEGKSAAFKKGHIVSCDDVPMLLSMGKEHIFVFENKAGFIHEDEAAKRLSAICCGKNIIAGETSEGKIEHFCEIDGLFCVDSEALFKINSIGEIVISTQKNYSPVKKNTLLAGAKVIPLLIDEKQLLEAEQTVSKPILNVLPYKLKSAAIITTGSEVAKGLITDTFTPVIKEKLSCVGIKNITQQITDDDIKNVRFAIENAVASKPDIILCTGGMSVDPDDNTPGAIKEVVNKNGGNLISYGAPVFPGAMFLLAYFADGTPILGLPGCVMYAKTTLFDVLLPRIAAGIKITKPDIVKLGHGGLCLSGKGCAPPCHFPNCAFCK
ncbi:MAG: molybdopterin-binding protein [Spirochaetaceae bacterium]|jgi:molybdopterin biosynthesis enzyme MoaB|nr:molybdopterin-binding protein [Spirochaetaceae bacterium]